MSRKVSRTHLDLDNAYNKNMTNSIPAEFYEHTRPYYGGNGEVSVLLIHGFTASPWSMRRWALYLENAGYRVAVPLLPGHGTTWEDMNTVKWMDWYDCVAKEYEKLAAESKKVFVAGLSMGGGLALRLAEHYEDVAGLMLVNPAVAVTDPRRFILPILQRFIPSLSSIGNDIAKPGVIEYSYDRNPLPAAYQMTKMWTDIRSYLDLVTAPLILFRSINDHVVPPLSAKIIFDQISATDVTEYLLERSYHVATIDYEAEDIFANSVKFIERILSAKIAE